MKSRTLFGFALVAAAFAAALIPPVTRGQAGADNAVPAALIDEITRQQTEIVTNQTKIDEKLAIIGENIRLARIFVSRGGGGGGASANPILNK